jgi:hypothetical protein
MRHTTEEAKSMIAIKCTYEDGTVIKTNINGSLDDAKRYFLGQYVNIGHIEDNVQKCVNVELL